jgi:hypothetical protein
MILKQRFANGRTQFIDIGSDFLVLTRANENWDMELTNYFGKENAPLSKDVHALIQYSERKTEPLYIGFPQWIYSNDGQLFQTLK